MHGELVVGLMLSVRYTARPPDPNEVATDSKSLKESPINGSCQCSCYSHHPSNPKVPTHQSPSGAKKPFQGKPPWGFLFRCYPAIMVA